MRESYLPGQYPRMFDWLTPGTFQHELEPNLELFYYTATVSTKMSPTIDIEEITGDEGTRKYEDKTIITRGKIRRDTAYIRWGTPNPTDYSLKGLERKSWSEIFEGLWDKGINEAVLQKRWAVEPPPRALEEQLEEAGAEAVAYYQKRRPNYFILYKRFLPPVKLFHPRKKMARELMRRGIVEEKRDPRLERVKSTLVTEGIWLLDSGRWGTPKSSELAKDLQVGMSMPKKFWRDTGIWHPISQKIDNRVVAGQAYLLQKERKLFAI